MAFDLEAARITALPTEAFYIADFISQDEEKYLLQKIASAPLPRWTNLSHRRLQTWPFALTDSNALLESPLPPWLTTPIIEPRLNELGIFKDSPHSAPNHVLINEYAPGQGIMPHEDGSAYYPLVATVSLGAPIVLDIYEKNHRAEDQDQGEGYGSYGHGAEAETEADAGECDSLRRSRSRSRKPRFRILQERRSLLITKDLLYTDFLHGILETDRDEDLGAHSICNWDLLRDRDGFLEDGTSVRGKRTSLTYRDVLKVAKVGNTMRFLGGK